MLECTNLEKITDLSKVGLIRKRMPILSDLSRRFHMLTTDAKPDPPRVAIEGHTNNLLPSPDEESKTKSTSLTPEKTRRQNSAPNGATSAEEDYDQKDENIGETGSTSDSREYKKPGVRTKTKWKRSKSQGGGVVNYNIINSNGVKIGSRTNYICNVNQYSANNTSQPEGTWAKPKSRLMPEEVESLTTCQDEITLDDMFIVKTHVGHGWRDVARRLSYSEGQIEQFEENHRHKGIDEVIYQMLVDWKQVNTTSAQIGILIHALWYCQEYDCAERLTAARRKDAS